MSSLSGPLFLFSLLILSILPGLASYTCGGNMKYSKSTQLQKDWIVTSDGLNRTFNVYIPASYSNSIHQLYPLTFVLHGGLGTGDQAESGFDVDTAAEVYNFIVIYPDGVGEAWNAGNGCCGKPWTDQIDDTGFISTLIDYFISTLCVNPNAVFSAGLSNGAVMSHTLACRIPEKIAAITAVEGTLFVTPCTPSKPVSIFQIWGTVDQNFFWLGGLSPCGISGCAWNGHPYSMNSWLSLNNCSCTFPNLPTPPPFVNDSSKCIEYNLTDPKGSDKSGNVTRYGVCNHGVQVQLSIVLGGGHAWSGNGNGLIPTGNCSFHVSNFPVNNRMFQFFLNNQRNSSSSNPNNISNVTDNNGNPTGKHNGSSGIYSGSRVIYFVWLFVLCCLI